MGPTITVAYLAAALALCAALPTSTTSSDTPDLSAVPVPTPVYDGMVNYRALDEAATEGMTKAERVQGLKDQRAEDALKCGPDTISENSALQAALAAGSLKGLNANGAIECKAPTEGDEVPIGPDETTVRTTVKGTKVMAWNGFPSKLGWGKDLEFRVSSSNAKTYTAETYLGGIPCLVLWTQTGGEAICNTEPVFNPKFRVVLKYSSTGVTMTGAGGKAMTIIKHKGDYYDALRQFAEVMAEKHNIQTPVAPEWAYNPIWETYGKEENFKQKYVLDMLPTLKALNISTITLDSGWYGAGGGNGKSWESDTGDFKINKDVIGTEADMTKFVDRLHKEGFRVRLWWCPGVAEDGTKPADKKWLLDKVLSATGDTGDRYLDARKPEVVAYTKEVVTRFVQKYGADGFKQDDVYQMMGTNAALQKAYNQLLTTVYETAKSIKDDFVINTCNCGIAQNFYDWPGQNQLITSDPLGASQFRLRAKYLQALSLGRAAILADHIELTDENDPNPTQLVRANYYSRVSDYDWASSIATGLVPETKFNRDPRKDTPKYGFWLGLYNKYRFAQMEWRNVAWVNWQSYETYCLSDKNGNLFYSFFGESKSSKISSSTSLGHLVNGTTYNVIDMMTNKSKGKVVAPVNDYKLAFTGFAFYGFFSV